MIILCIVTILKLKLLNNLVSSDAIASSQNFRVRVFRHKTPTNYPFMLHILRWVLYFQRFLHHLWCLLILSAVTFSKCAWAIYMCVLPATLCRYVLPGLILAHDSGFGLRCETHHLLYSCVYINSYILVRTVLCLPVACFIYYITVRLGFSKLFGDFVCKTYHI